MGIQQKIATQTYRPGETIVVKHDWGHSTKATLGSVSETGAFAWLQFGLAGPRKVRLTPTPSGSPRVGRFYGSSMGLWFVDRLTVDRLLETGRRESEDKRRAAEAEREAAAE